jgi:hypothetical protein
VHLVLAEPVWQQSGILFEPQAACDGAHDFSRLRNGRQLERRARLEPGRQK